MNIIEKLHQLESRKLEFKRKFPSKSNILKTIVAFANGAGGELILGVADDDKKIVGVDDPLVLEEKIASLIYDSVYPLISPFITVFNVQGKDILIVQILPGNNKPYFVKSKGLDKGVFVRIGSTNRVATPEIITELQRQVRGVSFETEPDSTKTINNLDKKNLSVFFNSIGISEYSKEKLLKWKILRKNNGDCFATIAGYVLFGKEGEGDYDFAGIRITRFQGTTLSVISEAKEYPVPLISKIEIICQQIIHFLKKESYLDGVRRLERAVIPFFAVREALVNAVVHRDYSMRGSSIKINVFDDRLEIISPGILFGNLDISDIGTGLSECRNRAIVRIFRKMNLMEELGTGIARILQLYEEKGLKRPSFIEHGQFFKVILPQEIEFTDKFKNVLSIVNRSNGISTSEIAKQM